MIYLALYLGLGLGVSICETRDLYRGCKETGHAWHPVWNLAAIVLALVWPLYLVMESTAWTAHMKKEHNHE